jgi:hypothetical protein
MGDRIDVSAFSIEAVRLVKRQVHRQMDWRQEGGDTLATYLTWQEQLKDAKATILQANLDWLGPCDRLDAKTSDWLQP